MRAANQERDSVRVSATPDHRRCCFLAAGEEVRAVPEEVEETEVRASPSWAFTSATSQSAAPSSSSSPSSLSAG